MLFSPRWSINRDGRNSTFRSAGRAGIKPFVVEAGTPGLKVTKLEHKMGIRASDTASIVLKE